MNIITIEEVSTRARHIERFIERAIDLMREMGMEDSQISDCFRIKYAEPKDSIYKYLFQKIALKEDELIERSHDRVRRSESEDDQ